MRPLILKCPSCSGDVTVARLHCDSCDIVIEGNFEIPALFRLNRAQLDFVEVFLKNRGNIREVERELGVSYPTVRARLDEVIEAIGRNLTSARESEPDGRNPSDDPTARNRRTILENLSAGKISPEDALAALGRQSAPKKSAPEEPDHG
ncbi:MAG TPA: DUF2089 domain-containing protein [Candidatus Binataceae bacterium]|nr:DUF2089 domain-containing protein [Candidatus Binataceae bacterium]